MNKSKLSELKVLFLGLAFLPVGLASTILAGTGIPGPGDVVSPSCNDCGQLYTGPTGYTLDDRQRLAQAFTFSTAVEVTNVEIGVSASYWTDSQVDVFITDGISSGGFGQVNVLTGDGLFPAFSNQPQTLSFAADLELLPDVEYYIVISGNAADAETNPGMFTASSSEVGSLGESFFANSGLGLNPVQATWTSLPFSTVSFQLIGTAVPEPNLSVILWSALLLCVLGRRIIWHYR